MRLHDEHQEERELHQDPRVKSTVSIACLCIEVDVHRSLTCRIQTCRDQVCLLCRVQDIDIFHVCVYLKAP